MYYIYYYVRVCIHIFIFQAGVLSKKNWMYFSRQGGTEEYK